MIQKMKVTVKLEVQDKNQIIMIEFGIVNFIQKNYPN